MNKNMQKTALTTSAVLAGMVLGVNVNQNGVHADTTTNVATTTATDTNQQLANLKSQQTANESAVASSNAATMSAATTSANSQIADLNNQIKQRQASAAATQQNKINQVNKDAQAATNTENSAYSSAFAKQVAANDTELKAAQAKVVTEQQKNQETAQENTDYQKQVGSLNSEHNATLNKLDQDLKNNTDSTNLAIQKEVERQKAAQQAAINQTAKEFDNQIADANSVVNAVQKAVNDDQQDVNTKQAANNAAQQAVKNAQDKLSESQEALKQAEDSVNDVTTDSLNVPQDYINVWKDYYNNTNDMELAKDKYPSLWQRNHDASVEAKKLNNNFVASKQDKNTPVHLDADGTLSRDDVIIATQYAAELINPIREAIGVNPYEITNASIDMNMENTKKYRAKGHNDWQDGHDGQLLRQIAHEWNAGALSESLAGNWSIAQNKDNLTVADLKAAVHRAVIGLLFEGADGSDNGHTTDLLGVREHKNSIMLGGCHFLGVDYDLDPVNQNGWIRFNSIGDDKGERIQNMLKQGYGMKQGTAADKTIQGSNYDKIAVPKADEALKALQKKVNDLQNKVNSDHQALNDANSKASTTASELKSAQDKLTSDSAKLSQAQAKVNELKSNKESTLKAMATDSMQSPEVKKLQDQFKQYRTEYDNGVKYENDQYNSQLKDLKAKHEVKLAEIAAQPTSLAELQSQLQAKLDILKANHDAKLKQITDDANAKIATTKSQKVNDPEIDKLQAQIDQIKSDLTEKQQELDSQYQTLKAKNQAEYNALAEKLKNPGSETSKGNNDYYTTDDGSATVKLPEDKANSHKRSIVNELNHSISRGTSTPTTVATSNSHANVSSADASTNAPTTREEVKQQAKLPQTGNSNSLALLALGAIASMFGFSLITKKRY
ncbi:SEC10/PgrA surface exclusion domain-containing protein [Limosilactobacillus reuteri]|uniref:SEC10/PgrA surface exclusion domain-containing protein n=1 Tax=Limosilactobacillus reuteri TaxID=1598 RepID=UPI001E624C5E|nr:SEC10/PgrA surface exclusion domain-containing protein [Limosilactobacillus reuteri]MCC4424122.1 SEC10/PgrA surface exclusion domain-containing protein [Limosilactobacillus reuteri]